MKAFEDYKYKRSLKALSKKLVGFKRNKMVQNLTTARAIGIICNISDQSVLDEILNLRAYFEENNIGVQVLGYFSGKEVPQYFTMHSRVNIFDTNQLNWYYKPESALVDVFADTEFDILIDLNFEETMPMRWVASLSKAKFKVGALNYYNNPFDLIITVDKAKGLNYLCEQMKDILYRLNNRFAQEPSTSF
ncbi:MAG: hypothetical protein AB7S48_02125 [Bacteroidales bacterium]